jgi:glycosyltransferase involved in cell wall biosynthesis
MTPYLSKDQAVSGTLAYAVGYGKAIVSTPYIYAEEMLENGRGLLASFHDSESIADCLRTILSNPELQKEFETKTKTYGRSMMWKNVATDYTKTFIDIIENKNTFEKVI